MALLILQLKGMLKKLRQQGDKTSRSTMSCSQKVKKSHHHNKKLSGAVILKNFPNGWPDIFYKYFEGKKSHHPKVKYTSTPLYTLNYIAHKIARVNNEVTLKVKHGK